MHIKIEMENKETKELKGEFTAVTSDGKEYKCRFEALRSSGFINNFYTRVASSLEEKAVLPGVDSKNFEKIVKFYDYYENKPLPMIHKPLKSNKLSDYVKDQFTLEFVEMPMRELCSLLTAACSLALEALKELLACTIATKFYGKNYKEIRKDFGIDPELTEEQDKELEKFFEWADELWPN
eukprot:TRINITY_DN409_c0_g1_i1.p2 TRINITY_DN409_c0_g1~~TRINITY_DN409_c0_g1_i1.p2  ORF type:complete len:181 (-),score=70.23 TRINITY_DN409_c0_g1_i1:204-746(-)